jgi:hypothetical protein
LEAQVVKLQGFKILPRRWVIERTFGWLMCHHRLVRDYEATTSSAEAWAYIAMIRIQLRRLAQSLAIHDFSDRLLWIQTHSGEPRTGSERTKFMRVKFYLPSETETDPVYRIVLQKRTRERANIRANYESYSGI